MKRVINLEHVRTLVRRYRNCQTDCDRHLLEIGRITGVLSQMELGKSRNGSCISAQRSKVFAWLRQNANAINALTTINPRDRF